MNSLAKKKGPNIFTILVLVVIALVVIQSGAIRWNQPLSVFMSFNILQTTATISECSTTPYPSPECSTPTANSVHVADTWQKWTFYLNDGSSFTKSSAIQGLGVKFELVNLNIIRSIKIETPILLATELQCQNFSPIGGALGSCLNYEFVVVRPTATVSLNGQSLAVTQNWWAAATFMYGRDHAGATVNYDFYVLLSGQMESSSDRTLDLRSQVKNLGVSQFSFNVVVAEEWSAYVSRISSPVLTDRKIVPVAYGTDFSVDLNQFSGTFTVPLPTQTVRTCTSGICVDIPATIFTTIGPGITATVTGSGTTFTLATTITDTWKFPNPFDICGWIPWLCGSTFGFPNWISLAAAIVVLYLILRRGSGASSVRVVKA